MMTRPKPKLDGLLRWWTNTVLALVLGLVLGSALASQGTTLRQEAFVAVGLQPSMEAGTAMHQASVTTGVRLDLTQDFSETFSFRAVLTPSIRLADPSLSTVDALVLDAGLSEAYLSARWDVWDVSLGLERWTLGELRLTSLVARDTPQGLGDARGVWGLRATSFLHPWRIEVGVTRESVDPFRSNPLVAGPLVLGPWSLSGSVRFDASVATVSGHALAIVSPDDATTALGAGASVSSVLGSVVTYADTWWSSAPSTLRIGAGLSGYAGDALWTTEVAWAPLMSSPFAVPGLSASRPVLRGQVSLPYSLDQSLELLAGVAWPASLASNGRGTQVDASVAWSRVRHDDAVRWTLSLTHQSGITSVDVTTVSILGSWRFYE